MGYIEGTQKEKEMKGEIKGLICGLVRVTETERERKGKRIG